MGYALGALIAGATADALGYGGAIALVAGLTAASGLWVLIDMPRTLVGSGSAQRAELSSRSRGATVGPSR